MNIKRIAFLLLMTFLFCQVGHCDYGPNILTGGTPTADSQFDASYAPSKAVDGSTTTMWFSLDIAFPHWWKYDLGAGVTKTVTKLTFIAQDTGSTWVKDFKLQGSNNNVDWTDIYTGVFPNAAGWQTFTSFTNTTAYRYYRIFVTSNYIGGTGLAGIIEVQMMETLSTSVPVQSIFIY